MSETMSRHQRWGELVHRLLTEPRGLSVSQLMKDFNIAERTWRKDRKELMESFRPFFDKAGNTRLELIERGNDAVLRLAPGFLDKGPSSEGFRARITAMLMIRKVMSFVQGTALGEEIDRVMDELEASMTSRVVLDRLKRDGDRKLYFIEDAPVNLASDSDAILERLLRATLNEERVRLEYSSGLGGQTRSRSWWLDPLSVVSCRGAMYLLGRRLTPENADEEMTPDVYRDNVRTFSVQRIVSLELTGESFVYPRRAQFDPQDFFDGHFGIYQRRDRARSVDVELIFTGPPWLGVYLQERMFHPTQAFEDLGEEGLRMTMTVNSMERVWPWIRSFGDDIRVIKPIGEVPRTSEAQSKWEKDWAANYE